MYLIRCGDSSYYKVGIAENPHERLATLQIGCPYILAIVMTCCFSSRSVAQKAEGQTHANLKAYNVQSEWFDLTEAQAETLQHDMIGCD